MAQDIIARGLAGKAIQRPNVLQSRVALLGDSITEQNTYYPSGGIINQGRGYWTWAQILSGQRLYYQPSDNYGVASDTIALASARVSTVIHSGAKICVVEIGTNDIMNGRTASQVQADLCNLILRPLMSAGVLPLLLTILPRGSMGATYNSTWGKVNSWLRDLGLGRPDLLSAAGLPYAPIVVDPNDYIEDKAQSTLNPINAYTRDQTHPTGLGAFWIGKAMSDVITAIFPPRPTRAVSPADVYNATNNPAGNMTTRGALLGTSGGNTTANGVTPTGSVATGWGAQRGFGNSVATMTMSKENPRTDGPNSGERQVMDVSLNAGASAYENYVLQLQANIAITAGQQFYAECGYEVTGYQGSGSPAGLIGCYLHLFTGGGGTGQYVDDGGPDTANIAAIPVSHKGVLRTPILTAATGNTAMNVNLGLSLIGTQNSSARVYWSDLMIRPVSL